MDLKAIFGKFVNREVPLTEIERPVELKNLGITYLVTSYELANPNDPTLEEIKSTAVAHGLSVRIWMPIDGHAGEDDDKRVNIYIAGTIDGTWRIADEFHIG